MIAGIPFNLSGGTAAGDAATEEIPLGGIKEEDYIVAVIRHDASAGEIEGLDVTDFSISEGGDGITAATIDTSGYSLYVLWSDNAPPPAS